MKTGRLSKTDGSVQCSFLTNIIKNDITKDVQEEEPKAAACGFEYRLVLTDKQTYDWASGYFVPPHKVKVVFAGDGSTHDCGTTSIPGVPEEYRTRSVGLSEMFWRDELQRASMGDGGR